MQSKPSVSSGFSFPMGNFLQNSSVIFYQCSLADNYPIVQISENVAYILGYEPDEFYHRSTFWMEKIHKEDREYVHDSFLDIINQDRRTYVYRFRHKAGYYLWLRDENIVSYDASGTPQAITGTTINITGQKEAEQEVRELNNKLEQRIAERTHNLTMANRKLKKQIQHRNKVEKQVTAQQKRLKLLQAGLSYINDMVVISKTTIDEPLDSNIIYVNKAFQKFTGYATSEVMGRSPSFLNGEQTQQDQLEKLTKGIKNRKHVRVEFINYRKNGKPYWVDLEMTPFPAEEEGMEYWIGINRDITDRKRTEQTLEENEERYRTYAELSFDGIYEMALDGTVIDCNTRACEIFGYSRKEFLGKNIREVVPEEYIEHHPENLSGEITTGNEVVQRTYRKKDGSTFPSEINTKIYHRNGESHIIAYVRDISERVAYEKAIKRSLREKSTLLAEVHHRVKNNLAVISGLLEMQTFNAENEQVISELRESQARIQSIATVHELLYQSESFSNINLEKYIDELVSYISGTFGHDGTNIQFVKDIEPVSLTVKQAVPCGLLLNELITNAYKHAFSNHEGTIFISLRKKGKNEVHLEVRDNGVGLPEDFDFKHSSSLGITLVNTLINQLGGSFSIQKKPSACFSISFKVD